MVRDALVLVEQRNGQSADADDVLALAAARDAEAFGALYERHRLAVYRYLRTRTSTEDDAIELTSITFERALASIHRFRPSGGGFLAWLLRIARNAAIDHGRRRRPTLELDVGIVDGLIENRPEDAILASERRRSVAVALATLPEPQRDAITLRYGSGLTARQIGEVIGRREAATQKLLSRALMRLREQIDVLD
jgi:RNA polymerase sigma-70 factor (ECF subfamily)